MFLVDTEKKTIQECTIFISKKGYTIIAVGNEILGLPIEDETHCLCHTREQAEAILYSGSFVPQ